MSEKLLKSYIKSILKEESTRDIIINAEPFLPNIRSWKKKAEVFFNELKKTQMGNDIISITFGKTGPTRRRIRFGAKIPENPSYAIVDILNSVQDKLSSEGSEESVIVIPKGGSVGDKISQRNLSSKSDAYYIPGLDINITFGGQGATSGQRGGGYVYENEILANVKAATTLPVKEGEDNHKTDVFIELPSGRVGIEVKLQNAQAGEPTMYYSFTSESFIYKGDNEEAIAMADAINSSLGSKARLLMLKIKDDLEIQPNKSNELTGVTADQYFNVLRAPGGALSKSAALAVFNISSDIIRNYYSQKGAQFVQVKGKGLFHIKNPISLDIAGKKIRTTLFDFKSVMGLIQFRKTSDTRFAMRTQFKGNPLKSLPSSKVDLDKPDDLKAFIEYIAPGTSRNNEGPENLSIIKEFIKRSLLDVI